jgi:hypothetical protein
MPIWGDSEIIIIIEILKKGVSGPALGFIYEGT